MPKSNFPFRAHREYISVLVRMTFPVLILAMVASSDVALAQAVRTVSIPTNLMLPSPGSEFVVPVNIDDATGVTSYRVQTSWPSAQLLFKRAENGTITLGWGAPVSNVGSGVVTVVNAHLQAASGSGSLLKLVFEVQTGATGGDLSLSNLTELNDGTISITTTNGSFLSELYIVAEPSAASVPEGSTATLKVKLGSRPSNIQTIQVSRVSGDTRIDTVPAGGVFRSFTPDNWDVFQDVELAAAEDNDTEDNEATFRLYNPNIPEKLVQVTSQDNDPTVVLESNVIYVPEGATRPLRVKLSRQPVQTVEVRTTKVSGDEDLVIESGDRLTFNENDWDAPKEVVFGARDDLDALNGMAGFQCAVTGFFPAKGLTVHEQDNDELQFETDMDLVSVPEGESGHFHVWLTARPPVQEPVQVSVYRLSGSPDVTVSPATLTFTAYDWADAQEVTILAGDDSDSTNDQATIRCEAAGLPNKDVTVTVVDDDPAVGAIRVIIQPDAVNREGAAWRVKEFGGDWLYSGDTQHSLPLDEGPYTVEFKDVPGWGTPADIPVAISPGTTTPLTGVYGSIRVTRPNNAVSWQIGSREKIKWSSTGETGDLVRIELWRNGAFSRNIKLSTANDGKVIWKIKAKKYSPGEGYQVRILTLEGELLDDFSNSFFTLRAGKENTDSVNAKDSPPVVRLK